MENKEILAVVILGSLLISVFASCHLSPPQYIPQAIDSVKNDKNRLGLNGKVKTMDIYYYRPEKTSSFFSKKFTQGEKWEENGIHHYHLRFNADGNIIQYNEYDKQGNILCKTDYTYETGGHTCTHHNPGTNHSVVRKYNANGQLLETMYDNLYGEINTYDDRGNLLRTEQTDGATFKPAVIEYDYDDKNLLIEKREYYSKGELSGKTIYRYDVNNLLISTEIYDYLQKGIPKTSFVYEYSDSNRLVKEYKINNDGSKELESKCKREYHPNGKLKTVIRNNFVQEEYDEQGYPIDNRPGFKKVYKDFQEYDYDTKGNWTETKNFKDYVGLSAGLDRILKPYVKRSLTYYE